jgi:predicted acetyltransferase
VSLEVRAATADNVAEFRQVLGRAFGWEPPAEREESFTRIWEPERSFCVFDGKQMVATSGAFSLELTIPGGVVPTAGTTMVSVLPTHRRRGALRQMMNAHLADVREREEPLAALWASDSGIYGRFGYGVASQHYNLSIDRHQTSRHRLAPTATAVTMIDSDNARRRIPPIYDRIRLTRPGFFRRSAVWWEERWFADPASNRNGSTSLRFAVANDDSGYIIYRQKSHWEDGHGAGEVAVIDLMASTPGGWSGLWGLALSHDLVKKVTADRRPPDDPVFDLVAARRRVSGPIGDALWVRPHDLAKALAARCYQTEGRLVLEVHDRFLERTSVVELEGGPDGAAARESDADPDLTIDLEDLGASYMGWSRFRNLAATGRINGDHATLTKADLMFAWDPQPWCPEIF